MLKDPRLAALVDEAGWSDGTVIQMLEQFLLYEGSVDEAARYLARVVDEEQAAEE